ncbi:MAG: cyclase family protein [Burkholderiales bacterium]|nr:cyclase family protein [Burkholderiales bacterium]
MNQAITRLVAAAAAAASCAAVQAQPLQTCYQSKWGANDQIGALNNITAENVLSASKLVKRGKAVRMGIETNSKTPAFPPRTFALTILQPGQEYGGSLGETKTNYNDDIIMGWTGTGSQLDGLGHIGIDGVYYNCAKGREFVTAAGLKKYGIETVPAIATRAVILDMVGLLGQDPVKEGTAFNRKEIEAALKRQGNMRINKGDVVVFYSGWTKLIGKDDKRYGSVEPGLGVDGANYLASLNVAMVGGDTRAVRGSEKDLLRAPDPDRAERHHDPGEPQRRGSGERQGLRGPVHARPLARHRRGAGDHQPDLRLLAWSKGRSSSRRAAR